MKKRDYKREIIIKHHMMSHIADMEISDRNRKIVERYVNGESSTAIASDYDLTPNGIRSVIDSFIRKAGHYMIDNDELPEGYNIYLDRG